MEQVTINSLQTIATILEKYINPKQTSNGELETLENALQSIVDNIFNIAKCYELLYNSKDIEKEEFHELYETLRVLGKSKYVTLTKEQEENIKKTPIYNQITKSIESRIDELTPGKEIEELKSQLDKKANAFISNELLTHIYEIIKKYKVSQRDSLTIFKILMRHVNMVFQKNSIKSSNVTQRLTEEQLTELFSKYGYDFKKVPEEFKERFYFKGNLENMEELFQNLPLYGIRFSETNKATLYILLRSNKEILENISKLAEEYNFELNDIVSKATGAFFEKERELDTRRILSQETTSETTFRGSFEDFYKIIKMVEDLGYDVKEAIEMNSSLFTSTSKRIAFNIQLLKEYGFMDNGNLSETPFKLSGLKSTSMQTIIDVFIELDELEYLSKNSSRLILQPDDLFIQKIYTAKRVSKIPNEQLKKLRRTKNGDKFVFVDGVIKPIEVNKDAMTNYVFDKETDEEIKSKLNEILRESIPTIENHSDLEKLEQYRRDNRTYIFDKVIISSRKVQTVYPILLREFPTIDNKKLLLFAVTYNTMMNSEEFENIKSKIVTRELSL